MKKTKVLNLAVSAVIGFSLIANVPITVQAFNKASDSYKSSLNYSKGPFDLSIAREDRIEEMLRKSGKIAKDATKDEAKKAVKDFLMARVKNLHKQSNKFQEQKAKIEQSVKTKMEALSGSASGSTSTNVVTQSYTGTVLSDKVLAVLMEFPNYTHNKIQPTETDLYYTDYTKDHFQQMLFGSNGYTGPNGQNFISMKQYYEQQSGGSYTVDGQISGWYMASQPATYYGGNSQNGGNDINPRALVQEALAKVAQDPNINLADYDLADIYDKDGDGNFREPDGIIDHLMIFHAGVGEEAGGGALGEDAIWSHSSSLANVTQIPGTNFSAYDYTVQPEDGAAGVCAHEYGHDLGLPDEYDTQYTGKGEPVSFWSIMSSGSWAGLVPGTEPTGFSPYMKEYFQARYGGNWLTGTVLNLDTDLKGTYKTFQLDQANSKGTNNDYIRVNLPKKVTAVNKPYDGQYEYFSGRGDDQNKTMTLYNVNISGRRPQLVFNTWYQIEKDYDYAYIQVRKVGSTTWTNLSGTSTTTTNPNGQNLGNGITGSTRGWTKATFNLDNFTGSNVDIRFRYVTDSGVSLSGFYVDNIQIIEGKKVFLTDNADSVQKVTLESFEKSNGNLYTNEYYLLEWRNHSGVDMGLSHIVRGASIMKFEPGLVVWHVDESYTDNWVGQHPGQGFVGVVDADQNALILSNNTVAETDYQIHDASFKMTPSAPMFLDLNNTNFRATLTDNITTAIPLFDDSKSYISTQIPDAGLKLPTYGLKIKVTGQSSDMSSASITLGTVLP